VFQVVQAVQVHRRRGHGCSDFNSLSLYKQQAVFKRDFPAIITYKFQGSKQIYTFETNFLKTLFIKKGARPLRKLIKYETVYLHLILRIFQVFFVVVPDRIALGV